MNRELKEKFLRLWNKHFYGADLPVTFYYTDKEDTALLSKAEHCLIPNLMQVTAGTSLRFDVHSIGCPGGKKYLGFDDTIRPEFEYFLSYGIPGKMEGERYKKSPELVKEIMKSMPKFKAPKKFIVFKRWDMLEDREKPEVVIFFAPPDVLSGLFTLASFDEAEFNSVIAPFSAGCASIVQYPYLEKLSPHPRCVIGMFDVSSRPFLSPNILSFSMPINKFTTMIENMEESFLITHSWNKIKERIALKEV